MTIPGTYEALASCPHLGRLVAFGWKTNAWYCRVGKLMPDGTYSWSNEVSLGVTTTKKAACAEMRHDGALEFVYLDSSGQPQMLRGYAVALDGTGTWVA
jgi:hypothetical protein